MLNQAALTEVFPTGSFGLSRRTIAESDVVLFAGMVGDYYGVHVDQEFARGTRFGRCIAHGAMAVGLISAAVSDLAIRCNQPAALPSRYNVKFRAPIFPGDTIESRVTVETYREGRVILDAVAANQEGRPVAAGKVELLVVQP